jgi:hypothetical protein
MPKADTGNVGKCKITLHFSLYFSPNITSKSQMVMIIYPHQTHTFELSTLLDHHIFNAVLFRLFSDFPFLLLMKITFHYSRILVN